MNRDYIRSEDRVLGGTWLTVHHDLLPASLLLCLSTEWRIMEREGFSSVLSVKWSMSHSMQEKALVRNVHCRDCLGYFMNDFPFLPVN